MQAEPVEAAIPAWSSAATRSSPSAQSAAYERCREIDNNEDSSLSEHIAAGGEAERLQNLLDRLDAAFELHNELI
jgi:hypothetical protein